MKTLQEFILRVLISIGYGGCNLFSFGILEQKEYAPSVSFRRK